METGGDVRLQGDTASMCKFVLVVLGLVGIAFTSTAQGTAPSQEIRGFPAPAYVTDSRPCPEGTVRLRMPAGPGYEVACLQSEDGRHASSSDLHGPSVLWYPAKVSPPQRYSSGAYHNRRPHGWWTFWHTNGQKEREGAYQDGHAHGRWTFWTADGQKIEAEFRAGTGVLPIHKPCLLSHHSFFVRQPNDGAFGGADVGAGK